MIRAIIRNRNSLANAEIRRFLSATATAAQTKPDADPTKANKSAPRPNKSFVTNIFKGDIEVSQVFPYPDVLNADEKEYVGMLVDPVEKFFRDVNNPAKNDENACLDEATTDALWELGAFGTQVPQDLGGLGLNNTQYARMGEIVGANDLGIGVMMGAHQSIGFKGILLYGTDEQKKKYLPQVSSGKVFAAFCLTEPSSGSDAASIRTRAVKSADGSYYTLNGSKIWISNGGYAGIFTVFAQTEVDDPKTGTKKDKITAFIVERGYKGLSSGPPEKKMGIKCSNTAEVYFEDVKIPAENVLGEEGKGFKVAMNILNNGRFGMSATLAGTMRHCIQKAAQHAAQRTQFGKKIYEYEAIQEKLARMAMYQYATLSMAYALSQNMDGGSQDYHLEAAISKVFASESAWYVCDEAIQILGGMGFMKEAGLERVLRDLRIFRIFEGTNEILRLLVALGGIQYAGSHLRELQKALKSPASNLGVIFKESSKRAIRSVGLGATDLSPYVSSELQDSAKQAAYCIDRFSETVEGLLIKHGKNIINEQFLLGRLADAAIDIYAMITVLSRATKSIKINSPTKDLECNLAQAWCTEASYRAKKNLKKISSKQQLDLYKNMKYISQAVIESNDIMTTHPLDL